MYTQHFSQQMAGSSSSSPSPSTNGTPVVSIPSTSQGMPSNPYPQYQPPSQYHPQMPQNLAFDPSTMTYQPINKNLITQYPMHFQQQQQPMSHHHAQLPSQHNTVYSFVVPTQQQKRPRRRYEEIERIYQCNWENCTKAYGTLNHLNAHVTMQKHGPKRTPEEFKEIRRLYKEKKKSEEAARKKAAEDAQQAYSQMIPGVSSSSSSQAALWSNAQNQALQMAPPNTWPNAALMNSSTNNPNTNTSSASGMMERGFSNNMYIKDDNYMDYFNGPGALSSANPNSSSSSLSQASAMMSQTPSSYNSSSSPMAPSMSMGLSSVSMTKSGSMDLNQMNFSMMNQPAGSTSNSTSNQQPPNSSSDPANYGFNYNQIMSPPSSLSPSNTSQAYPYMYDEKR